MEYKKLMVKFFAAVLIVSSLMIQNISAKSLQDTEPNMLTLGDAIANEVDTYNDDYEQVVLSTNEIVSQNQLVEESVYSYSGALNQAKLCKSVIEKQYGKIWAKKFQSFVSTPSVKSPYKLGTVSSEHLNSALNSVNFARELAGLPNVTLNSNYNNKAQYGAVVTAANNELTHYPSQPAGMSADFYQKGKLATSSSNISCGSLAAYYDMGRLTFGYLQDNGSNRDRVGHRRWVLNPQMGQTGFGYAVSTSDWAYSCMYAFDRSGTTPDYDFISWPSSGNFPNMLLSASDPWSITLNPNKFRTSSAYLNTSKISVTVVAPNGKTRTYSSAQNGSDAYYTINLGGFGVSNAIIFQPGSDVFGKNPLKGNYTVTIKGLTKADGSSAIISFVTDFYTLNKYDDSTDAPVDESKITGFVNRLYQLCFTRPADNGGLVDWKNKLLTKKMTGADVAKGFFFSQEMSNRNLDDSKYLDVLYQVMMDRPADDSGKQYWLERLSNGVSREGVYKGFAESQEFTNVCNSYGIIRGNAKVNQGRDRNTGLTLFVSRLYTKALGRDYDISGLNDWCSRVCNGTWSITRTATTGFFNSPEFQNKNLSNEEYVKVLYRTFLDREYDQEGLTDWTNQLNLGEKSRDEVLKGFSYSKEFSNITKSYGL